MGSEVLTTWPAAAVPSGGTITLPYPAGFLPKAYARSDETLTIGDNVVLRSGAGFSASYGATGVTITLSGGHTVAKGERVSFGVTTDVTVTTARAIELSTKAPMIAAAGDSILAQGVVNTATLIGNHPYSPISWLMGSLGQRAYHDHSLVFATAGRTTGQFIALNLDALCASPADIVVLLLGTNNVNGGVTATTLSNYKTDITTILDRLYAAGKTVVFVPVLARGNATQDVRRVLQGMRTFGLQLAFSGRRNLYVADANIEYGDPLSATYAPRSGFHYDDLHPQTRGAQQIGGVSLYRVLDMILPPQVRGLSSFDDLYDATYNPGGNLLTNGILDGTAGTKPASQGMTPTGNVATSWGTSFSAPYSGGSALAGMTVAASKRTAYGGRVIEQAFTIASGSSYTGDVDSAFGMSQSVDSLSRIQVGDVLELGGEAVLDVSATDLPLVSPRISAAMTLPVAGGFRLADMAWVNNGYSDKEGYVYTARSPRWTVTEVPSFISFSAHFMPRQGANSFTNDAVFGFRQLYLRKIIQ